jgi:hypothetical protein
VGAGEPAGAQASPATDADEHRHERDGHDPADARCGVVDRRRFAEVGIADGGQHPSGERRDGDPDPEAPEQCSGRIAVT